MKERDLSRKVVYALRCHGYFVQRIESGLTGRGIPDIYWAKHNADGWIELKVVHQARTAQAPNRMWRPGQSVWMYTLNKIKPYSCYTLIAWKDGYYSLLYMKKPYKAGDYMDGIIHRPNVEEFFE